MNGLFYIFPLFMGRLLVLLLVKPDFALLNQEFRFFVFIQITFVGINKRKFLHHARACVCVFLLHLFHFIIYSLSFHSLYKISRYAYTLYTIECVVLLVFCFVFLSKWYLSHVASSWLVGWLAGCNILNTPFNILFNI